MISERLKSRYKVEFDLIAPKIPFRETIKGRAESKYRHKSRRAAPVSSPKSGCASNQSPAAARSSSPSRFRAKTWTGCSSLRWRKGSIPLAGEGVLAGYKVVDLKVDFYDGKMHPVDSKDIAFQIAGKEAFKEAFMNARPCLLEPIYDVEIKIPEEYMGNVMGDLSSRRGKILGIDSDTGYQIVKAQVPQMELYHYSTTLRSLTAGRGIHIERFNHYEEMPRELRTESHRRQQETGGRVTRRGQFLVLTTRRSFLGSAL